MRQRYSRAALMLLLFILQPGCDSDANSPPGFEPNLAVTDDSAAARGLLALADTTIISQPMVLQAPGGFTVTLTDRECAAPTNVVRVATPVDSLLSGTMCQEPIGSSWHFAGPFQTGTAITLSFVPHYTDRPGMRVTGSYPVWTVTFEDGGGYDWNDFYLRVEADCPVTVGDSIFDLQIVRDSVHKLWDLSNADDPVTANRIERTGYLEQDMNTGEYYFRFAEINPLIDSPCRSHGSLGFIEGRHFVAHVHTHPFTHLEILPMNCPVGVGGAPYDAETYGGASRADIARANAEYPGLNLSRFFILDKDNIYNIAPGTTVRNARSNVQQWPRQTRAQCPVLP